MSAAPNTAPSNNSTHKTLIEDTRGFQLIAELLKDRAGINLPWSDKNASLMASRLQSILKRQGFERYRELHGAIMNGDSNLLVATIEALTTNKTEFFRERQHIDFLAGNIDSILEENKAAGRREFRIWCAAASTGQEPYTLAMTLKETIENFNLWSIKFLATDIDTKVLKRAVAAGYTDQEAAGLSAELRQKYFDRTIIKDQKGFLAKAELRDMIRFAEFNLMTDPFPFEHKFDVVFCRNVLIYFDRPTQGAVVNRLVKSLRVGGLLFLGHTETGVPKPSNIEALAVAVYRKTGEN